MTQATWGYIAIAAAYLIVGYCGYDLWRKR